MKHGGNVRISVLAGVLLSASAIVIIPSRAAENPYSPIVERNVFNLRPPPPPINPADLVQKKPAPKITLTGITTILGKKVTFLTTPPTKPGAAPEAIMLAEGQAQNEIEVKSIDEKAGVVQVVNHGEPETLDFETNGAKPSGPMGGVPQTPISLPAPIPGAPPAGVQPGAGTTIRPLRSLPGRNSSAENNNAGAGLGGGVAVGNVGQQPQVNLSPEEQVALIEVQRAKALQDRDPVANLLPTTELTSEITGQPSGLLPQ